MTSSEIDSKKPSTMVSDSSKPESLFSTKTPNRTSILPTRSRDPNLQTKPVKRQIFSSPTKPEITVNLPERFVILEEFFNGLDTAIRLLKLKGSSTSFANICPKIERLTNRQCGFYRVFTYGDLAQMMHIYPEAIEVKRVLKCDQGTSCMKPSLHVNLNTDSIVLDDTSCGGTKYMELRRVFHSRLVDFYKAHPKDEIPKELLPEPFNSDSYSEKLSVDLGAPKLEVEKFDVLMEEMEQEQHIVNKVIPDSTLTDGTEECLLSHTESRIVGTPVKVLSTPSKDLSTPIRLMSATPSLQPSRKSFTMTPDDNDGSVRSTGGLERRSARTRCLDFGSLEDHGIVKDDISNECNDEGINHEADDASDEDSLLHSMKEAPKTEAEKHNLPTLVDLIDKLFHTTKKTVITKEELLHKIIASQLEITDRKEVEEQLSLMLQLVPDWISETKASSGDFLVRINKMSTVETVRARLKEATSQDISTVY